MPDACRTHVAAAERGVSLVEILVGLAIGLIGVLIMFQTVSVWDARSRSSTSSSDAQVAGTLAMFALERDIRGAGEGFGTAPMVDMGCTVNATDTVANRIFNFRMRPVEIVDNSALGMPDEIHVLYGNSAFFVSTQVFNASTSTTKQAGRRGGFKRGDVVVVAGNDLGTAGSATCQLVQVTDDTNPDGVTIGHTNGNYNSFYTGAAGVSQFNPTTGTGATFTTGNLFNLGPKPRFMVWTVDLQNATLDYADFMQGDPPTQVAEGVVDLKAQYGVDTDGNGQISDAEWTTAAPADWTNVRAIRVGILVRSRNFEKPAASAADASYQIASAPTWSGGAFDMHNVDGTADTNPAGSPNNWRLYRYRVYEKVIPLRNMVWGTSP
jgi:type IV pilus assembly protein PilW